MKKKKTMVIKQEMFTLLTAFQTVTGYLCNTQSHQAILTVSRLSELSFFFLAFFPPLYASVTHMTGDEK